MKRPYVLALVSLVLCSSAFAAGTLENVQFYSDALSEYRWGQVYLPEGYDPAQHYPAIYFLHGSNADHTAYPQFIDALDQKIASGTIQPVIAIKPHGDGCGPWGSYTGCNWVNSETLGNYEDFVVQDVVSWAEANYPIIPDRAHRMVMGHSMGAFGAMHMALRHPDIFGGVAAHSGYLYFQDFDTVHRPLVIAEQTSGPPYNWIPTGMFTGVWFMFSAGFSPNPTNPPCHLDFLLDSQGAIRPDVWARWLEHDPATIAESLAPETAPAIYFDCGTLDEFQFYPFNVDFDAHLTALGIPHDWRFYEGGHGDYHILQRFKIALQFLNDAMVAMSVAESDHAAIWLSSRSNPALGGTTIDFGTARPGKVMLTLYDLNGRKQATLFDGELPGGAHRIDWDAGLLPAGAYYCVAQSAGSRATRRLVVIR